MPPRPHRSTPPGRLRLAGRWLLVLLTSFTFSDGAVHVLIASAHAVATPISQPGPPRLHGVLPEWLWTDLVVPLTVIAPSAIPNGAVATVAESFRPRMRLALPTAQVSSSAFHWLLDPTEPATVIVPVSSTRPLRVTRLRRSCADRWEVVLEGALPTGQIDIRLTGVVAPAVRVGQYVIGKQPLGRILTGTSCSPGLGFDVATTNVRDLAFSVTTRRGAALYPSSVVAAVRSGLRIRRASPPIWRT